jgi:hypothetical protein
VDAQRQFSRLFNSPLRVSHHSATSLPEFFSQLKQFQIVLSDLIVPRNASFVTPFEKHTGVFRLI